MRMSRPCFLSLAKTIAGVLIVPALVAIPSAPSIAAEKPDLELIMSDPDWIGNAPSDAYWSDFGEAVYYQQKRTGDDFSDLYRVPAGGGTPERVEPADEKRSSNGTRVYNADRTKVAWVYHGDIMIRNLTTKRTLQATRTADEESDPMFMADGRSVAFMRDGQHFIFRTDTGLTAQAADICFEKDPNANDTFDALHDQQMRSFETLRREQHRDRVSRKQEEARQTEDPAGAPLPIYLGEDFEEISRSLSPSGQHLLVVVKNKDDEDGEPGKMPNYVTPEGYLAITETRTRVGRNVPPAQSLILIDLKTRSFTTVDYSSLPGYDTDPLADLRKSAIAWHVRHGADREKVEKAIEAPDERPLTVDRIEWNRDGTLAAVQVRATDNKDRWLVTVDPQDGELRTQHRLTDAAWINWEYNEFGWLRDGHSLWYLSEESGYSHLYVKNVDARRPRQLTRGRFVVREAQLDAAGNSFYVVANRSHPGNYEVYRVPVDGGNLEQVTAMDGVVSFQLSPSGDRLLLTRSYIDRHEDLYTQALDTTATPLRLTDTVSDRFKEIEWIIPEIVKVPSSHVDRPIYTKLYLPRNFSKDKTYPAVMFVHGAGYTQNAHFGWPYYFREFMFHTLLADDGFIVIDMDYRASEGYGREWRTAIYRNMGHPELEDFEDGIDWLVKNYNVDRKRVGIYGGSYGGFMTLMALFREPDLFAAGAALRPVVDWMQYNHSYTSNILNSPDVDPVAYERSSPINFVKNLEKPLLVASGMQDDNVFFQDSVMLVQRLIELKKENFEFAVYPLDPHGFVHPESWLDEYRRIWKLMQEHVK